MKLNEKEREKVPSFSQRQINVVWFSLASIPRAPVDAFPVKLTEKPLSLALEKQQRHSKTYMHPSDFYLTCYKKLLDLVMDPLTSPYEGGRTLVGNGSIIRNGRKSRLSQGDILQIRRPNGVHPSYSCLQIKAFLPLYFCFPRTGKKS